VTVAHVDADVGDVARRAEHQQIAGLQLCSVSRHRLSALGLLVGGAGQVDLECGHHVPHESTAIEAVLRGRPAETVAAPNLGPREGNKRIAKRPRSGRDRRKRLGEVAVGDAVLGRPGRFDRQMGRHRDRLHVVEDGCRCPGMPLLNRRELDLRERPLEGKHARDGDGTK